MNTVLQQELIRFNKLIKVVTISLNDLVNAIDGFIVMSAELDQVGNGVFDNVVPELWQKVNIQHFYRISRLPTHRLSLLPPMCLI